MTVGDVLGQVFLLLVLAMASYRIWRLVGYDDFTAGWRARLADADGRFAGWLYDAATCPWCAGTWVALAVVTVAAQVTSVWLPAVQAFAAAVLVGWLHERIEAA